MRRGCISDLLLKGLHHLVRKSSITSIDEDPCRIYPSHIEVFIEADIQVWLESMMDGGFRFDIRKKQSSSRLSLPFSMREENLLAVVNLQGVWWTPREFESSVVCLVDSVRCLSKNGQIHARIQARTGGRSWWSVKQIELVQPFTLLQTRDLHRNHWIWLWQVE